MADDIKFPTPSSYTKFSGPPEKVINYYTEEQVRHIIETDRAARSAVPAQASAAEMPIGKVIAPFGGRDHTIIAYGNVHNMHVGTEVFAAPVPVLTSAAEVDLQQFGLAVAERVRACFIHGLEVRGYLRGGTPKFEHGDVFRDMMDLFDLPAVVRSAVAASHPPAQASAATINTPEFRELMENLGYWAEDEDDECSRLLVAHIDARLTASHPQASAAEVRTIAGKWASKISEGSVSTTMWLIEQAIAEYVASHPPAQVPSAAPRLRPSEVAWIEEAATMAHQQGRADLRYNLSAIAYSAPGGGEPSARVSYRRADFEEWFKVSRGVSGELVRRGDGYQSGETQAAWGDWVRSISVAAAHPQQDGGEAKS